MEYLLRGVTLTRKNKERRIIQPKKIYGKIEKEGTIRELTAVIKLLKEGYRVSMPIGSQRYDLIAERYPKYIRIQVKNLKLEYRSDPNKPSSIDQWVINAYTTPKGVKKTYSKEDTDVIFAIDLENDAFAIVSMKSVPKSGVVKISERSDRKQYLNSFDALKEV